MEVSKKKVGFSPFVTRRDWIILAAVAAVFFVCLLYSDILITARQSLRLWDCLFSGRFFDFYAEVAGEDIAGGVFNIAQQGAGYNITVYIVFAVWNFPLWVLERLLSADLFTSVFALVWIKLLPAAATLLAAYLADRICVTLGLDVQGRKWSAYLFLSGVMVFSSVIVCSQYDVLSLCLVLLGVNAWLKGDMKRFVVWFALAGTFKLFSFFVFIPLLLLRQKKIWRAVGAVLICAGFLAAVKAPFILAGGSGGTGGWMLSMLKMMFVNQLPAASGAVSLFPAVFAGLCIFCYVLRPDEKSLPDWGVYICFAANAVFFLLAETYPYWWALMAPWVCILMAKNVRFSKINLLADMFMSFGLAAAYIMLYPWCFSAKVAASLVPGAVFGRDGQLGLNLPDHAAYHLGVRPEALVNSVVPIALAVFVAGMAVLLIVNCPAFVAGYEARGTHRMLEGDGQDKSVALWRLAGSCAVCCLPLALFFIAL